MAEFKVQDVPEEGRLDAVSVPLLLAQAWRDERDGCLSLERSGIALEVVVRSGAAVAVRTARGQDRFARFLEETGRVDGPQRAEIERVASDRRCPQASAALALKRLDPKSLYQALRDHQRTQLAGSFEWREGFYRWTRGEDMESGVKPFDVLALLQRELPRRWGTERLFAELTNVQDACGDISPRFRKVASKLAREGEPAARAIAQLDGASPLGRILGLCAGEPLAAATLWTVLHTGILRLGERRPKQGPSLEFEVEVRDAPGATAMAGAAETATRSTRNGDKGEALREEIEALLKSLGRIDHYSALGLDEDASAAQIKKAYFKAAKKYHPDALARLGLDDLKASAARAFARIAEAFETLSDPEKKRAYDAGGSDAPEIDTARLARAETSFRKGEILSKMGNFVGALDYLESAVELWPEESAYQALLGWALYKQPKGDAVRAAQHLELALNAAPGDALIHFRLGMVMRALGETDRANELMSRARALEPRVQA